MVNLKQEVYKEILARKEARLNRTESKYIFRASEAGDCRKVLFNRKMNIPPENSFKDSDNEAEVMMMLEDGVMHQEQVTKHIERVGKYRVTNVEDDRVFNVNAGDNSVLTISGHPDLIVHDEETGLKFVVDVKAVSTYYCKNLADNDFDALKRIYPTGYKSVPQIRLYMSDYMFDTDGAIVFLKDRNTSRLFEFHIEKEQIKADRIIQRFKDVHWACMEQKAPDCDFLEGDKRCKYCPYPGTCGK